MVFIPGKSKTFGGGGIGGQIGILGGGFDPTSGGNVNIAAMTAGGAGSQDTLPIGAGAFDPSSGAGFGDYAAPPPPPGVGSLPGIPNLGEQGGGINLLSGGPMGYGSYKEWLERKKGFGTPGGGGAGGESWSPPGLNIPEFGPEMELGEGRSVPLGGASETGGGGGGSMGGMTQEQADARNRQLRQEYLEDLKKARTLDLPGEAVSGVGRLVEEYNRAFGEAKGANEARYQRMLGITEETTGQRGADIRAGAFEERSDLEQGLARSGLSGTTVSPTLTAGVRRREEESLNRLADMMQGTKLGIMERREDQYPDAASLQASLSGLGQGYGGPGITALYQALGNVRQY